MKYVIIIIIWYFLKHFKSLFEPHLRCLLFNHESGKIWSFNLNETPSKGEPGNGALLSEILNNKPATGRDSLLIMFNGVGRWGLNWLLITY